MSFGRFLWTIVVIYVYVIACVVATDDQEYTGTYIPFESNFSFTISGHQDGVLQIKAASSNYFAFQKEGGAMFYGEPADPPLGWDGNTYYLADPSITEDGDYTFLKGTADIEVRSDDPVKVTVHQPAIPIILLFGLAAILVWVAGIAAAEIFND